jgi:glycogen debranching enzyme
MARSFNRRSGMTRAAISHVVDGENGDDASFRPNQIAISLTIRCSRKPGRNRRAVEGAVDPFGLRSLAPDEPDFKPRYFGDLRARDAAYHQGTVWAWLIGPFIDA